MARWECYKCRLCSFRSNRAGDLKVLQNLILYTCIQSYFIITHFPDNLNGLRKGAVQRQLLCFARTSATANAAYTLLIWCRGRNRTGTDISIRRILSPLRLPVPPPRHDERKKYGGGTQNRTGDEGFADLCLTAWLCRHIWSGKRGSNSRPPPWQGGALPLSYFRIGGAQGRN